MNSPASTLGIFGFPGRYVQGPGALNQLGSVVREIGADQVAAVADATVRAAVGDILESALARAGIGLQWLNFPGECTAPVIATLAQTARDGTQVVVGLGGGKAIDTAKGVSKALAIRGTANRLVIAPTVASNDSPTSRVIVIYNDAHVLTEVQQLVRNPDVVIVDTDVICRAPARFFAAGIGDALSKRFEATQCAAAGGRNFFGGRPLGLALTMAERCYDVICADGLPALTRVRSGQGPDAAVERVVEATVLLSGLAFESGGLSLAHALNRGFTAHPVLTRALHGEMVAFGALVQLFAQEEPLAFIREHAELTSALGLPVHLGDLGASELADSELRTIARLTCTAPYIGHLQPPADEQRVFDALKHADALGLELTRGAPR